MEYVSRSGKVLGIAGESTEGREGEIARAEFMPFSASALVAPTKLVRELGGFDDQIQHAEDFDLVSRLARHGRVITVPEVLARYRIHAESASASRFFTQRSMMHFLAARVRARDRGRDLTWDEFSKQHTPTFRERRGDLCAYCYRTAGLRIADGRVPGGAVYLAASILLGPRYTISRLLRQRGLKRRDRA
jgi:GT2 family glycosyltransferase